MTYNSFTNIVRQICKSNKHYFYTELKYDYSIYTILFFVAISREMKETRETREMKETRETNEKNNTGTII